MRLWWGLCKTDGARLCTDAAQEKISSTLAPLGELTCMSRRDFFLGGWFFQTAALIFLVDSYKG